jgi:hypothetical protein
MLLLGISSIKSGRSEVIQKNCFDKRIRICKNWKKPRIDISKKRKEAAMGTSGTGRFPDYPGTKGNGEKGNGPRGPKPPTDDNACERAVSGIVLEEVANCDYFKEHEDVPAPNTVVFLKRDRKGPRLAVQTASKELVGLLPTKYNYLVACMSEGYTYQGSVLSSSLTPFPRVAINLGPK